MFEVKNGVIKITKGDSAALGVSLKTTSGEPYEMQEGDTLTLTVRKNPKTSPLMSITSDTDVITFTPEDTNKLVVGNCCFDIELTTADDNVFTVVGLTDKITTNMIVYPEVTKKGELA